MVERRIKLTGIDEGLNVRIYTTLAGADSPTKIQEALQSLFPDFCVESLPPEPVFGTGMDIMLANEGLSMSTFLNQLHEQRILDTALDAMSRNLTETSTSFAISRLAALGGKIAFPIPEKFPWEASFSWNWKAGVWRIGCKLQHGMRGEAPFPDRSRMNVPWTMTARLQPGFDTTVMRCASISSPTSPRTGQADPSLISSKAS